VQVVSGAERESGAAPAARAPRHTSNNIDGIEPVIGLMPEHNGTSQRSNPDRLPQLVERDGGGEGQRKGKLIGLQPTLSHRKAASLRISSPRFIAPLLVLASWFDPAASLAATPFPMASGNYSENFSDIANWTNNFASGIGAQYWASVALNASGTIPDGVRTSQSTATFVTNTTEGVQKGSGNIQLLATNATDFTHAVAIDLLLDFTGVTVGTLSYDFAAVINTTGNRNGSLRVYTSTDGVTFTELVDASVLNFQNNVAFSKQVSQVQLPASFTNSPTARIRFYDYNGTGPVGSSGARPKASIDNVVVTTTPIGGGPPGPVISNLSTIPAAPADTQSVHVQASVVDTARAIGSVSLAWGLSAGSLPNVIAMAPTTGDFWQTTLKIPAQAGGTTVYYRVTAVDDSVTVESPILNYLVTGTGGGGSAPVITSVFQASDSTLQVFFDEPVDLVTSQTPGNYSVNSIVAVNAVRDPVAVSQVTITVRAIPAGDRTLSANGVGDLDAHYTSNETFGFHFVDVSIPSGYYDGTAGLSGSALLIALHNIIKGHTAISYSSTATAFQRTDKRPNGHVWDVYSDVPGGTPPYEFVFGPLGSGGSEGVAYNREHTFPQSWFGGSVMPMYSDLWNIYPTDSKVNNERANYPYGEVGTASWTSLNGSKLGSCVSPGYSGTCFEPIDAYKGDLVRSQFYMASRYFNEDSSWPGGGATQKSQLLPWAADQYLEWSVSDPVSWKERLRNGAIYEYQHNRNPFVDHPEFASAIYDSANTTGVGDRPEAPLRATLRAASPNPFNSRTTLVYDLPRPTRVTLRIYDAGGRVVRSLVSGIEQEAGRHRFEWDGRDNAGAVTATGLYFGRLEVAGGSDVKRIVQIR
jgi:endonuclease I